jgi:hypothetical protein
MEFDNQGCQFDIFMTYVRVHQNFVVVFQSVENDSILTWAPSFLHEDQEQIVFGAPITSSHRNKFGNFISLVVEDLLKASHAQVKFWEALELHLFYLGLFLCEQQQICRLCQCSSYVLHSVLQ